MKQEINGVQFEVIKSGDYLTIEVDGCAIHQNKIGATRDFIDVLNKMVTEAWYETD